MKTSLFTLLLGLLALTATGCNRSNAQGAAATDASELPWGETDVVAVAFVGYGTSFEDFKQTPAFANLKQRYGLPDDISCISRKDEEGEESATDDELYLVIPRDPNASVAVNDLPVERLHRPRRRRLRPDPLQKRVGHALLRPLSEQWRHDEP